MSKPWKCWLGMHDYVRRAGDDNPNHKVCSRCGKKHNLDTGTMLGGMG
jgi:hypothetical protein